jgi:hypothetical protein
MSRNPSNVSQPLKCLATPQSFKIAQKYTTPRLSAFGERNRRSLAAINLSSIPFWALRMSIASRHQHVIQSSKPQDFDLTCPLLKPPKSPPPPSIFLAGPPASVIIILFLCIIQNLFVRNLVFVTQVLFCSFATNLYFTIYFRF